MQRFCIHLPLLFIAAVILSGCATNISERKALPVELLQVEAISTEGALRSNATDGHISSLEAAVRQEIATRNRTGRKVDLKLVITRAEFVSQGTRALAGMLAGANHLDVSVYLLEPGTSSSVGEFLVRVENNPGGFGAFADPVSNASRDAAKAIVDKIFPPA